MRTKSFIFLMLSLALILLSSSKKTDYELTTEYLVNPEALTVRNPHFSWKFSSSLPNDYQAAYQVIVFKENEEYWNSGKVTSDQSVNIEYKGKPLISNQSYTWKVCIWDSISQMHNLGTAKFSTGLYESNDWKGNWISLPIETLKNHPFDISKTFWIGTEKHTENGGNINGLFFTKSNFVIDDITKVQSAQCFLTGDDECLMNINGQQASDGAWLRVDVKDIKNHLQNGLNQVLIRNSNRWGNRGTIAQIVINYNDGSKTYCSTDSSWFVSEDSKTWYQPTIIGSFSKTPGIEWLQENMLIPSVINPVSFYRKEFSTPKKIKSAKLYITALGWYKAMINGQEITDYYFTPGFTDYNKRVLYQAYDITRLLNKGTNCFGALLSEGWYAGSIGWGNMRNHYGNTPKLLVQLQITYEDLTSELIVTDSTWTANFGHILRADILDGEFHDNRLLIDKWTEINYDDKNWKKPNSSPINENIVADNGVPVKVMHVLKPIGLFYSKKGSYIFDLGQNMVGVTRFITNQGKEGDTIVFRYAEMLDQDSLLYTKSLRTAAATDYYILSGAQSETLEPFFTFHGFRYVEVLGCRVQPQMEDLIGKVIYSEMKRTGTFECSNPLINQIYENALWGQRGNFLSIPTDCPQRDERLGWMGDAQVFVKTAAYNYDVAAFFNKWMNDVIDAQSQEGGFPDVAPRVVATGNGAPGWGDAGIIVPLANYHAYNNLSILKQHYPAFVKWVEYIKANNPDLIWKNKKGGNYSDWLNTNAVTNSDLLATAYFAHSTRNLAIVANILGKSDDEFKYMLLFDSIKMAFQKEFIDQLGRIKDSTQTACVLPIAFEMLNKTQKDIAIQMLIENINKRNMHHSTGFLGIGHLLPVLTDNGYVDIAFQLISNNTFPSLGYMVENGATTIWERWDGYVKGKGFQDEGMNSFNHYSLGSPVAWLYTYVGGIKPTKPGFQKFDIKPYICGDLSFANTTYESVYGRIESRWTIENENLNLQVNIPFNTWCNVYFPSENEIQTNLKLIRKENGWSVFEAGAGIYLLKGKYSVFK